MEAAASTGGIIAELDVESLTENLMRILITLDEIYAEGELKLQKREQVTLDFHNCNPSIDIYVMLFTLHVLEKFMCRLGEFRSTLRL